MKKRNYRAQKVNEIRWEEVADRVKERTVVWAIDVAKVEQYGVLMGSEREVMVDKVTALSNPPRAGYVHPVSPIMNSPRLTSHSILC
ncbi:MAG: hypothetical protein ACHBNF_05990 [Chromatiales bacterium]